MIKVVWLAVSVLLILSSLGIANGQICRRIAENLQIRPPNGRQVLAVLTNGKQDHFDKIHANNRKCKNIFFFREEEHVKN
jgi:hypothetical protein